MAKRRMFSQQITESDSFLDMPLSAQALYFHLGMCADDDGFVNSPKRVQRVIGANDDDLKLLIAKNFVIAFDTGVVVIKHWKINNFIRSDRYTPTVYAEEMALLYEKPNRAYSLGIPNDNQWYTNGQPRLDKTRLDKNRSCSSVLAMMTETECSNIFSMYEDADLLIDEIDNELNFKNKLTEIRNAYRYVIGYATNKGWLTK